MTFNEAIQNIDKGDLSKVDLRIGDITKNKVSNLYSEITAANFGKLQATATDSDILLGAFNSIIETIGVMGAFLCKNDTIKDIILVGNLVTIPKTKEILDKVETLHNIRFHLPENREYAGAFGSTIVSNTSPKT